MASFGVYVPDESELLKRIQAVADAHHDGKVSAYARAAIERDLDRVSLTDAMSPTIVVDLTRQLLGEPAAQLMVEVFARSPRPDAQARFLRRMLQDELAAFERAENFVQEQPAPYGPLFADNPAKPLNPKIKYLATAADVLRAEELARKEHKKKHGNPTRPAGPRPK